MLLYIVRHGDPNYTLDCLTERGKLQAEAVGKRIAASKIDRIFSSPMGRARETAAPACRLLGLEPTIEEWTHEILDERLTPFPDGKRKSVTLIQNTYYRENGNMDLDYNHSLECVGFNESGMGNALKYIEENGKAFLERLVPARLIFRDAVCLCKRNTARHLCRRYSRCIYTERKKYFLGRNLAVC